MELRDWLAIAGFIFTAGAGLLAIGKLWGEHNSMKETVKQLDSKLQEHHADGERHVNHFHMCAIDQRMEKIESAQGRIEEKLDRVIEKFIRP